MIKKGFQISLKSIALAMLFSSFSAVLVFSQEHRDSLHAIELLQSAEQLAEDKAYSQSTNIALQAAAAFSQLAFWGEVQKSYHRIFLNGHYSKNYQQALDLLAKGLEQVPTGQPLLMGKLHTYMAYSYNRIGDVFASMKAYEKSIAPLHQAKDSIALFVSYTNVANRYVQLSDYTKAIEIFKNAQALVSTEVPNHMVWSNAVSLGGAYLYKGDLEKAKLAYAKAQTLRDSKDGTFAWCYANIYMRQKAYQRAIDLAQQAIIRSEKREQDAKDRIARAQRLLGEIYLAADQPKQALAVLQRALPSYEASPDKRELGKIYFLFGEVYRKLQEYDQSLAYLQLAFTAFVPNFQSDDPTAHPGKKGWAREIYLPEIYHLKGDCFYEKYQSTKREEWLYRATENYQLAVDCVQNILLNYDESESKLALRAQTHAFYEKAIQTKLECYELTRDAKYQTAGFAVAQQATAFVLRELLNEQKSLEVAGVPEEKIEAWRTYRQQINLLQGELAEASEGRRSTLRESLTEAKRGQSLLKQSIAEEYPKFARMRNDLTVATVDQLQEKLAADQLLIKYFRGDQQLYIFSISKDQFNVEEVPLPDNFDTQVYQYRRAISDLDFINDSTALAEQQYLQTAHRLYQLLLEKPLEKHQQNKKLSRLTIVGDGVISAIPFQALLVKESTSWEDPSHLVLNQLALSYSYFCKLLLEPSAGDSDANTFMAFGIEFDEYTLQYLQEISKDEIKNKAIKAHLRSGNFSNLPFSDDEAKEVAELMNGKSWLNKEATKAQFLQSSPEADIIHLATHSILDVEQPNQSALVFIKTRDSLDNLLRLSEIYNLEMAAEMLVLSACNTGYGPITRGEGINSLARAFNIAGVPSVMATLWGISDESSKKIMKGYYEFLKTGLTKDVALQKAQLAFLHDDKVSSPSFRLPVYWAAWTPIGEQRGIHLEQGKGVGFYLLLGSFLALLLGFFIYKIN